MVSEAQKRAKERYEKEHYWLRTIRFPKEMEEQLKRLDTSVNGFVVEAVREKLESLK